MAQQFTNIFELLTTISDISQFISLKKAFDHSEELAIMKRFDKQDDEIFTKMLQNQEAIINILEELKLKFEK